MILELQSFFSIRLAALQASGGAESCFRLLKVLAR